MNLTRVTLILSLLYITQIRSENDGVSSPIVVPEDNGKFSGFRVLGKGYDERTSELQNNVFNYDTLDLHLPPNAGDETGCTFVGSEEANREDFRLDFNIGIDAKKLFKFDAFFGINRTSSIATYTGYYACMYVRRSAVVNLNRNAMVDKDLLKRVSEHEFSSDEDVHARYGTGYIDTVTFGSFYTVTLRFTTTNRTLLNEWKSGFVLDVPISDAPIGGEDAIKLTAELAMHSSKTFSRTDTSITVKQTSRGFRLVGADEGEGVFEDLLANPEDMLDKIQLNIDEFHKTGSGLQSDQTHFRMDQTTDTVDLLISNSGLVPITFAVADLGLVNELPINRLTKDEKEDLTKNLKNAEVLREGLEGLEEQLRLASRDVLDSYGIQPGSSQAMAYSLTLTLVLEDVMTFLQNSKGYERQPVSDIIKTPMERYICGLNDYTLSLLKGRVEDLMGATDDDFSEKVFTGRTCAFTGIVVNSGMRPLMALLPQAGCPADGSEGTLNTWKLDELIKDDVVTLVLIGGQVRIADDDDPVHGVRFDAEENVVGFGYQRKFNRDNVISIDNKCEVIDVNTYVQTDAGEEGIVTDLVCVGFDSCIRNQRVDSREILRQLGSGRLEVELLNGETLLLKPSEVMRIPRPSTLKPVKPVKVRDIPCSVNDRCKEAEGAPLK